MTITAALVVFAITWFMVFFCVLPLRFTSQQDTGHIVPGTPRSAPSEEMVGKKAKLTTVIAVILWAAICSTILWSGLGINDLDVFNIMGRA